MKVKVLLQCRYGNRCYAGIKSVLVDADMRNSVLVKKNDMERQDGKEMKGLANYLAEDFSLDEVTYESPFENGDIIPNVENIINPSMLLEGDKFGNMLNELSKDYRYVFVDAPPLGLVSDAEKLEACVWSDSCYKKWRNHKSRS